MQEIVFYQMRVTNPIFYRSKAYGC
uniref:Uncharacterized protein n=1 Tax=Romanomermis culicivorax TaxID=13658 RepID=A0A915I730_ROMCU